jgi:hypothetical protein
MDEEGNVQLPYFLLFISYLFNALPNLNSQAIRPVHLIPLFYI